MLLGWSIFSNCLIFRVNFHHGINNIWAQKWNSCLKTMRHCHSIRALVVDIVEMMENSPAFFLKGLFIWGVSEIKISSE